MTAYARRSGKGAVYKRVPEPTTGYAFDPGNAWWSSVVAQAAENLIVDGSFESGSVGGTFASTGSFATFEALAFGAVGATHGRYAAHHSTGDDDYTVYVTDIAVSPGNYAFAFDLYAVNYPLTLYLYVQDQSDSITIGNGFHFNDWVAAKKIVAEMPGWHRVYLLHGESVSGTRRIGFFANNADNGNDFEFWTDAWQFETGETPTTFIDGNMVGFSDRQPYESYYFTGAPNASTSVRRARTGSGGRVVSFSEEARFATLGIVDLGMPPVEQKTYVLADGREIHRSIVTQTNQFTITGYICGATYNEVASRHAELVRLLRPNNTPGRDQMMLRYQALDSDGFPMGFPVDVACVYTDGLRGNVNNLHQERIALQFRAVQPYVVEIYDTAHELTLNKTLYQNGILYRDEDGEYFNLGTGTSNVYIRNVGFTADGTIVATGSFTTICGDSVSYFAQWDGSNWVAWGTDNAPTPTTYVYAMDTGANSGYQPVVAVNAGQILELSSVTDQWDLIGTKMNNLILTMDMDVHGDIWFGGDFTDTDPATNTYLAYAAKYDRGSNSILPLGQGLNGPVATVLADPDGNIWFGGSFTEATDSGGGPALPVNRVAVWRDDIGWDTRDTGLNGTVKQFLYADDGYVYAVGDFTRDGGDTYDIRGFARWNGTIWEEVFPLEHVDGGYGADGIVQDENGIFWFFIDATLSDDYFDVSATIGASQMFGYRDGVYYPAFATNTDGIRAWATRPGNETVISYYAANDGLGGVNQNVVVPALNRIDYDGSAECPFVLHIDGPSQPVKIFSETLGLGAILQDGLSLGTNEQFVLRNDLARTLLYSNSRPNLNRYLNAGASNIKDLLLQPGENRLSVYCLDADSAEGWLVYRNRHYGISQTLV